MAEPLKNTWPIWIELSITRSDYRVIQLRPPHHLNRAELVLVLPNVGLSVHASVSLQVRHSSWTPKRPGNLSMDNISFKNRQGPHPKRKIYLWQRSSIVNNHQKPLTNGDNNQPGGLKIYIHIISGKQIRGHVTFLINHL